MTVYYSVVEQCVFILSMTTQLTAPSYNCTLIVQQLIFVQCLTAEIVSKRFKCDVYLFDNTGFFDNSEEIRYNNIQLNRKKVARVQYLAYFDRTIRQSKISLSEYSSLTNNTRFNIKTDNIGVLFSKCPTDGPREPLSSNHTTGSTIPSL